MPRIARVVAPGVPHHVTQRGNRRQRTFFTKEDYRAYIELMAKWCRHCAVDVWAYCLMPNHVHLIVVPKTSDGLKRAIGEAHRLYTLRINQRQGWRGHLWQGRFYSYPMDDVHLLTAARYIEQNPVKAGLATLPEDYPWSSAFAHLTGEDDHLVKVEPLFKYTGGREGWRAFLAEEGDEQGHEILRKHETTGRPVGSDTFIDELEQSTGRMLRLKKPGPEHGVPTKD